MNTMKRTLITALVIVVVLITLYALMWADTNSLITYVEGVFKGEVPYSEVMCTPMDDHGYYKLNDDELTIKSVDIKITRRFVLHNFFDGVVYVKYTYYGYTETGETSGEMPYAKWTIHKEDGQWKITDIVQGP